MAKKKYTEKVLENYKKILVSELKKELNKPGSNLEKSIVGRKLPKREGFIISMNDYGLNVNQGRSAGKFPPPQKIEDWVRKNSSKLNLENTRLSDVRGYGNRFTTIGAIDLPRAWIFHFSNNLFTGDLPDFSKCGNMYDIYLHNNSFSNYVSGSLASNSRLRRYYVYNNNLTLQDAQRILVDLKASYDLRNRSNCTVNMTGNVLISEAELVTFPEYFEILTFLRSKGWTILLNP